MHATHEFLNLYQFISVKPMSVSCKSVSDYQDHALRSVSYSRTITWYKQHPTHPVLLKQLVQMNQLEP